MDVHSLKLKQVEGNFEDSFTLKRISQDFDGCLPPKSPPEQKVRAIFHWTSLWFAWHRQKNNLTIRFSFSIYSPSQWRLTPLPWPSLFLFLQLWTEVAIKAIKEVRTGKSTEVMRNKDVNSSVSEDCVFSIIFGDDFESLDLMAANPEEANIWVTGIISSFHPLNVSPLFP